MNHFVAIDSALDASSTARSSRAVTGRLGFALLLCVGAAASFALGAFVGLGHSAQYNHSRGACIALEFAEYFGAVAKTQKRQVLYTIATLAERHRGLFPRSVEAFEDLCIRTWTSEMQFRR